MHVHIRMDTYEYIPPQTIARKSLYLSRSNEQKTTTKGALLDIPSVHRLIEQPIIPPPHHILLVPAPFWKRRVGEFGDGSHTHSFLRLFI